MLIAKNLDAPDEKRSFDRGDIHTLTLGGVTFSRATFRPGWRWSSDVAPHAGTDTCQATHASVVISGRLRVRTEDGTESELGPGDAHLVGPGHDAWVVGDEPCVTVDFAGTVVDGVHAAACPCGVAFRIRGDASLDHLVAAVQQHALGSHGHEVTRDHVLAEITPA